ncbi:hypothetical protein [Yersinia mollaretii]|uniref:hypothetical protein n=1 Tax=Yersinia mollaretii TaxID=33060 RepID=UPI0005E36218|nr:hypothetical protein [Yersinia mollaretii]MDN0109619.1 hypothetical protein [Yersinia mollaretii]PJE88794.1 hypothetical protein CU280_06750 [Yersinia mollaretii]CQD36005.1 Uncharacterised protein [Yersinia mollaretii]CQG97706.1 Uncharacterised protein [Yersinia mollaretii]
MEQFDVLDEYLAALSEEPKLAIVTVSMAMQVCGVKSPTVHRMMQDERLRGVKIEKNKYVLASSLAAFSRARDERTAIVRNKLETLAKAGRAAYYNEVMDIIDLSHQLTNDRKIIGEILGTISRQTHSEFGFLLSVLVHKKPQSRSSSSYPSDGFYNLAEELGYAFDDKDIFTSKQTKKVFKFYKK